MSYQKRLGLVTGSRRCYCCLGTRMAKNCTSKETCKVCGGVKHHSLLHSPAPTKDNIYLATSTPQYNDPMTVMIQKSVNKIPALVTLQIKLYIKMCY